jgi:hypothetical protein
MSRSRSSFLFVAAVAAPCAFAPTTHAIDVRFVEDGASRGIQAYSMANGMGGGVAAADFDDDGHVDLFVPTAEGVPHQLYRNLGGGVFEEIAGDAGLGSLDRGRVALWLDADDDGRLDLFVAADCFGAPADCPDVATLRLFLQVADAEFVDATLDAGFGTDLVETTGQHRGGMCAGDVNGDGWLDLLIGLWGGEARLFLNDGDGDGSFTDVSATCGLGGVTAGHWQPVMYDADGDGVLDIFSAVDFVSNHLWINQGAGTFLDAAGTAGVDHAWNDMGVAPGDYDNDGDLDLFVSEIFDLDRHHVLYRNDSVGSTLAYVDVAPTAGVHDGDFGWGCTFLDADLDGRLDLAVTNGYFSAPWDTDPSRLFHNAGGDPVTFTDASAEAQFDDTEWGSALVAADLDRDGDLDLVQACNAGGPLRVLENQRVGAAVDRHHLVIRPRTSGPNPRAIGAVVRVSAGGVEQMRLITAGTSCFGQEPAEAFFGLGSATSADAVTVEWPDGTVTVRHDVPADQVLTIPRDACGEPADLDGDGVIGFADLLLVLAEWGPCAACPEDLDGSGAVDFPDLLEILGKWGPCSE